MARKRHKKKALKKRFPLITITFHPVAFPAGALGIPTVHNWEDAWQECKGTPMKDVQAAIEAAKKYARPIDCAEEVAALFKDLAVGLRSITNGKNPVTKRLE